MRNDDEVAVIARRERNGDGWRQATLGAMFVDHLAHGADVDSVSLKDFDESVFERISADRVEQVEQARRVAAEVFVALGEATQKGLTTWRRFGEAIEAAMLPGPLLFCD